MKFGRAGRLMLAGLAILGLHGQQTRGQERYAVQAIDPALRGKASAVVRFEEIAFDANADGSGTTRYTRAVTIFREAGKSWGDCRVYYGGLEDLEEFEGSILDADGNEIRELEDKDVLDRGVWSESELTTDYRIRTASLAHNVLPYTVVFRYEVDRKAGINWPSWTARRTYDPVELTRFEVRHPAEKMLRYRSNHDTLRPVVRFDRGDSVYVWEARNVPQLPDDGSFEDLEYLSPIVLTAPSEFAVEGHRGDMTTWDGFGKWMSELYRGRSTLPPDAAEEVRRIASTTTSWKEQARAVYQYLQGRTRYISVQLGIGGWQPFEASFVHTRRYGDCKALSNYMVSMLREAGLTAYPALIRSGHYLRPTIEDFPSNQFNHVVVCLPHDRDTVWLECTSQSRPFGQLGSETEGRPALIIDDRGSVLVRTPTTAPESNLQVRTATCQLQYTGALRLAVETRQYGTQQNDTRSLWMAASPERRQEVYLAEHGISDARVQMMDSREPFENFDATSIRLSAEFPAYASKSDTRLFVPLNPFERNARPPAKIAQRLGPKRLYSGYLDIDTIRISLPRDYVVEALPDTSGAESFFGSYARTVLEESPGVIRLIRRTEINATVIPVDRWDEYVSFMTQMARGDRAQAVLRRR